MSRLRIASIALLALAPLATACDPASARPTTSTSHPVIVDAGGATSRPAPKGDGNHTWWVNLPACEFEDSDGPCKWDAGIRGDGQGDSFWVGKDGVIHYINFDPAPYRKS